MTLAHYFVVVEADGFTVTCEGRNLGHYGTRDEARDAARHLAQVSALSGIAARVVVQGDDRQFRTDRIFGDQRQPA